MEPVYQNPPGTTIRKRRKALFLFLQLADEVCELFVARIERLGRLGD